MDGVAPDGTAQAVHVATFIEYLKDSCYNEVAQLLSSDKNPSLHYGFTLHVQDILHWNVAFGQLVLEHPSAMIPIMKQGIVRYQRQLLYSFDNSTVHQNDGTCKSNVHPRLTSLPCVDYVIKDVVSDVLKCSEINKLLQITGTVIRTGASRILELSKDFKCTKCLATISISSDPTTLGNTLTPPRRCTITADCKSTSFTSVATTDNSNEDDGGETKYCDYQEIKIQERVETLTIGSIPRSLVVVLTNDLVDSVKAGENVVIVGTLLRRWKPCVENAVCDVESVMVCNSVSAIKSTVNFDDNQEEDFMAEIQNFWKNFSPLVARNHIVASICPQVHGCFMVKLAVALTLIGGCSSNNNNSPDSNHRVRGEPHMLLVGDPGTAKSQFLRFTAAVAPRSVLTTGVGTTSAGLTCSAVRENGCWVLEAGALVLADRGVCCIDEFSGIKSNDRTSIHEAMEQQTISVAKAGLVCTLNTRTSVFAVTNPRGTYDPSQDMSVNTSIGTPLLSRFDIILVLLDTLNTSWDTNVSDFILNKHIMKKTISEERKVPLWSIPTLQKYIAHVKETYHPKLGPESMELLTKYYQRKRGSSSRSVSRSTIRLLESLTRISQAHARLMMRHVVTSQDAIVAISIIEASSNSTGEGSTVCEVASTLHATFPEEPDIEYEAMRKDICSQLNIEEEEEDEGEYTQGIYAKPNDYAVMHGNSSPYYEKPTSFANLTEDGYFNDSGGVVGAAAAPALVNEEEYNIIAQTQKRRKTWEEATENIKENYSVPPSNISIDYDDEDF